MTVCRRVTAVCSGELLFARKHNTGALDPGTYYYEVVSDDDSETRQITVGGR